jgi:aryl-alcohol dehydrogenase-like predicted oxidoreductase
MQARAASRSLGPRGPAVSNVALAGSFGISADDAVRAFHELNVTTFFVTSSMKGLSEGVRRLVAEGHRDRLTIISGAAIPFGFMVPRAFRSAAKNVGAETIDVFLLYWVQAHWYVTGKTWPAMRELKDAGLVRSLGISCHDRPMARSLVDELGLDVVMLRYNAAHRGAEREVFDSLETAQRPGIIAYTATRWGGLLKPHEGLGPMSPGECYRFALGHPCVDTVLCGAKNFDELAANVHAAQEGPLAPERLAQIKQFGDLVRAKVSSKIVFAGG